MRSRVLELNIVGGGPMSLMKGIVRLDISDIEFDIATFRDFDCSLDYDYFDKYNVKIYFIESFGGVLKKIAYRYRGFKKLMEDNKYDCVHIHHDASNLLLLYGFVAKKAGVRKIVLHSHSTGTGDGNNKLRVLIHMLCRPFLKYIGTDFLACSNEAAKWMFPNINPKNVFILKNGIDLDDFRISNSIGCKYREILGFSETDKVIGHVGRFDNNKNQAFLVELLAELKRINSNNYRLLLVGDGKTKEKVLQYAEKLGVSDLVIFTGNVSNVQDYLQASDLFILPSLFEGLGMAGIEAQACGLPCVFSTGVPKEAKLTENVEFISLEDKDKWLETIERMILLPKEDNTEIIRAAGYDIKQTAREIERLYTENIK